MTILIAGATGHVGHHPVDTPPDAGREVAAFTRSTEKTERNDLRPSIVRGDILDRGDVHAAVERANPLRLGRHT